jgi:hypothetical protein
MEDPELRPPSQRPVAPARTPLRPDHLDARSVLALQRSIGNHAACALIAQRVHEIPIEYESKQTPRSDGFARKAVRGIGLVFKKEGESWNVVDPQRRVLDLHSHGQTYVNAFVQPARTPGELWVMHGPQPPNTNVVTTGSWGEGEGSHKGPHGVPVIAAGELKWHFADPAKKTVKILAANQKTSIYGLDLATGGSHRGRATQSDLLAPYQLLVFFGRDGFQNSVYGGKGAKEVTVTDPEKLAPGEYMVQQISTEHVKNVKDPKTERITYRPTEEERQADEMRRQMALSGPDTSQPASGPGSKEEEGSSKKLAVENMGEPVAVIVKEAKERTDDELVGTNQ